jgi:hypothetical protein
MFAARAVTLGDMARRRQLRYYRVDEARRLEIGKDGTTLCGRERVASCGVD